MTLQGAIDSGELRGAPADAAACGEPREGGAAGEPAASTTSGGLDGVPGPEPAVSTGAAACSDAAGALTGSAVSSSSAAHDSAADSPGGARSASAAGADAVAPVNMQLLLACAVEIASAMAYLHARGITHNDLNCSNVLLATDPDDPRGFKCKVRAAQLTLWHCMASTCHMRLAARQHDMHCLEISSVAASVAAELRSWTSLKAGEHPFAELASGGGHRWQTLASAGA